MKRSTTPGIARTRLGFTLVELLAVIAIIAVLAGLLIVGLGKILQKGRQTQALNQLRTLGSSIDLYRTENKNQYPFSATAGGGAPYWSTEIGPYLPARLAVDITDYRGIKVKATPDLLCPLIDSDRHNHLGDFGVNGALLVRSSTSFIRDREGPQRITGAAVANPSQTILVMTAEATDRTPSYGNWYVASHQYITNLNATQRPSDRGTGVVLCRFVDGHTEAVPLTAIQENPVRYLIPR